MIDKLLKEWTSIPEPARAQIQSFIVSGGMGAITAIGSSYSTYKSLTPGGTVPSFVFLLLHSAAMLGGIWAAAWAAYRAAQAKTAINNTVTIDHGPYAGRKAILLPSDAPEAGT